MEYLISCWIVHSGPFREEWCVCKQLHNFLHNKRFSTSEGVSKILSRNFGTSHVVTTQKRADLSLSVFGEVYKIPLQLPHSSVIPVIQWTSSILRESFHQFYWLFFLLHLSLQIPKYHIYKLLAEYNFNSAMPNQGLGSQIR